jgi:hypothetical protein
MPIPPAPYSVDTLILHSVISTLLQYRATSAYGSSLVSIWGARPLYLASLLLWEPPVWVILRVGARASLRELYLGTHACTSVGVYGIRTSPTLAHAQELQ